MQILIYLKLHQQRLCLINTCDFSIFNSQYKEALKALSNGELSSVMKILEEASISGNYRLEATLLLALAHTRNDGATVDI